MERETKVLIVAVMLIMVAVGVAAYPYLYSLSLPTTITLQVFPDHIAMMDASLSQIGYLGDARGQIQLRHATVMTTQTSDGGVMFTYSKDSLLDAAGFTCQTFSGAMSHLPDKYTELTFSSESFSQSATLLMCDTIAVPSSGIVLTITETTIGT